MEFRSLDESVWTSKDTISFDFEIKDTISPMNMFIHVRNTENYAFSNLYVITNLKFPDRKIVVDTLQYEMSDKNGKLLGQGMTSSKENKLFYKERTVFPMQGTYTVSIYQSMRKQGEINSISLIGVKEVGLSLEKIN